MWSSSTSGLVVFEAIGLHRVYSQALGYCEGRNIQNVKPGRNCSQGFLLHLTPMNRTCGDPSGD